MLGPVRTLARSALSFAATRAQIAANEIEEQAVRAVEILLWLACALFFGAVTLVFVAILILLLFWDSNRLLAAGLVAALFAGATAIAAVVANARMRERPAFLAATLAELHRDREKFAAKDPRP
jgi:uncharacterized membrane protein YqjE